MTLPAAASGRAALDFDALYRAARDDVFAYVASLLGDRAAAEDVTALAFERAFRKRKSYKPARGTQRAWLFGIARNAALDELRRRTRSATLVTEPTDVSPAPDEELERTMRRAAVRTALAALPARDHELIALKFHAGLDNSELAEVLGVSVTNAGTRLHRALTKLREILDDQS
ncbi:MAG TPA: sigma-70 family RNA polymerase sigma factor [Solirubrobacteraceae bacterium]|nr:sigma-70 family RNA polymerase sigma factor [Solirubrobacteraceae bacterium]